MKPNILVVDDSPTIRTDLRFALLDAGFAVTLCDTKAAAEDALHRGSFAAVILDVSLPDGNGIDFLPELKQMPGVRGAPILLLSVTSDPRVRGRGVALGADEYVLKPYDRAYVVRRIRELIRYKEATPLSSYPPPEPPGDRVLLVGGNASVLDAIAGQLQRDGNPIVIARSGPEALQILAADKVGVVVLDLDALPGEGVELCRQIRALPCGAETDVVILVERDDPDTRHEVGEAGAVDVVLKSPSFGLLRIRVRTILRHRRLETRLNAALSDSMGPPPPSRDGARDDAGSSRDRG